LRCLQAEFLLFKREIKEAEAVLETITEQKTIECIKQPDARQSCEAIRLRTLSSIYRRQKNFLQAEEVLKQSYIILTELEDREGMARVLNKLGVILGIQNNYEQSVKALCQSQTIYNELNYKRGLAKVFKNLGSVLRKQGQLTESLSILEQSLSISEELDDQRGLSIILNQLGITYQALEQFEDTEVAFKRSYEISLTTKDNYMQVVTLKELFQFLQNQGKLTSDYIQNIYLTSDSKITVIIALNQLARQSTSSQAVKVLRQTVILSEQLKDSKELSLSICLFNLAGSLYKQNNPDGNEEAESVLRQSISICRELDNKRDLIARLLTLYGWLQKRNSSESLDEAEKVIRESISIDEELEDWDNLSEHLYFLNILLRKRGKLVETIDILRQSVDLCRKLKDIRKLGTGIV
jgi:tetratricopeptide (TPR) repeat protein